MRLQPVSSFSKTPGSLRFALADPPTDFRRPPDNSPLEASSSLSVRPIAILVIGLLLWGLQQLSR